jgi:FkbM family methyltransferase
VSIGAHHVTNASGRRLYVDAADERSVILLDRAGDLNPHSLQLWQDLLASGRWDLVVDVGANYGEMLLGVDLPAHAKVVAFEPNERVAAHLERSLHEAALDVDVRRVAVSDVAGEQAFLLDEQWSGRSRLALTASPDPAAPATSPRTVTTTTLDDVIGPLACTKACIKIDVEGAEDRVLAGGGHIFPRLQELAIHIEILHRTPEQIAAWTEAWRVYLFDVRTRALIRVDGGLVDQLAWLLEQPWIYRQDAVLRRALPA